MNRLVVCMGKNAQKPYKITYINVDVCCIEEFCYYLCEYTNLLDRDLMDEELVQWINKECELHQLAETLETILKEKKELSVFVVTILRYVQYIEESRICQIEQILAQNEGLSPLERKKKRADNLFKEKKYYFGLDLYHQLLEEIPETDKELLVKTLYNCGVSYVNLFYYEIALEMFERGLKLCESEKMKQACLYCRRNLMSKQEYVQYIAEHEEFYEDSIQLEKQLNILKKQWESTSEHRELEGLFSRAEQKELETQKKQVDEKLNLWQDDYVIMVQLK